MNALRGLIVCLSMYSIIPSKRLEWNESTLKYCFCFLPFIGALAGGLSCLLASVLTFFKFNPLFCAIAAALLPIVFSGGIHLDGLLDSCDAFFSYGDRQKKLEILSDPRTGAFGAIGVSIYLIILVGLYSELLENGTFLLLLPVPYTISRAVGAIMMISIKKAKASGLAYSLTAASDRTVTITVLALWILAALLLAADMSIYISAAIAVATAIYALLYIRFLTNEFRGITGDLTGFFISSCESLIVLILAVGGRLL